jgi:hypothetical protein
MNFVLSENLKRLWEEIESYTNFYYARTTFNSLAIKPLFLYRDRFVR